MCVNLNLSIRFWDIWFICLLDSWVLDTSLHCVSLSMTRLDLSIHFYNIVRIYLLTTRDLDGCFTSFANPADCFGDKSPRNDKIFRFALESTNRVKNNRSNGGMTFVVFSESTQG